jgi:hypothetical protein
VAPAYNSILNVIGPDSNTNGGATCKTAILNLAQRSPITVAFVLEGDPEHIQVGHTLSPFSNDPLRASPYDDHVIVFVGDDLASSTPVLLPNDAFSRTADLTVYNTAHMTGVNGHGTASGAVVRFDHQTSGTQNTDNYRTRRVMVLPPDESSDFLSRNPTGIYELQNFYNFFLQPHVASAVPATRAKWEPVEQWWRAACMNQNGLTECKVRVTGTSSALPAARQALNACTTRITDHGLARVGVGGPQLSNAAFNAGVQRLETVLNNNAQQRLQFERDRAQKSFADRYGEHLDTHMYKMTGAADDDHLPDIHKILAKAPKG